MGIDSSWIFSANAVSYQSFFQYKLSKTEEYEYNMEWISSDVYVYSERYVENSYVNNSWTDEKTIEEVESFCMLPFGLDSLVVFANNGRRGCLDTIIGKILYTARLGHFQKL